MTRRRWLVAGTVGFVAIGVIVLFAMSSAKSRAEVLRQFHEDWGTHESVANTRAEFVERIGSPSKSWASGTGTHCAWFAEERLESSGVTFFVVVVDFGESGQPMSISTIEGQVNWTTWFRIRVLGRYPWKI